MRSVRYAAYFAPPAGSRWWQAGSSWLGRCAIDERSLPQPPVPGVSADEQRRLTAGPRRYGWHATLRAPFALAAEVDVEAVRARLRDICRGQQPFTLPPLKVALLDGFLALVPDAQPRGVPSGSAVDATNAVTAIDVVARACVTGLQALAAPPSSQELQRRRAAGLTRQEQALMLRWGYPFVMERFRFHFSLTGPLVGIPEPAVTALQDAATAWFGALPSCRFESVALFMQPEGGADFVLLEHFALGAFQRPPP